MKISEKASLLPFNTFGINAIAKYFIEYTSVNELTEILNTDLFKKNKFLHVGRGSNLLFTSDYDGVVLHSLIKDIQIISETDIEVVIEAGSGVTWDDLVKYCVEKGWNGIENLTDIPGETGAAAVQNIGAYSVEIKDVIRKVNAVDIIDSKLCEFSVAECVYGYRTSIFKNKFPGRYIITSVEITLSKKPEFKLEYQQLNERVKSFGEINTVNVRRAISEIRKSKLPDPAIQGNAGSFFMNPVISEERFQLLLTEYPQIPNYRISENEIKIPAAWLIEQCGWKGKSFGKAAVHPNHALVIVNTGNSPASDITGLANEIIKSVETKFSILLKPEVIYV